MFLMTGSIRATNIYLVRTIILTILPTRFHNEAIFFFSIVKDEDYKSVTPNNATDN